MDWVVIGLRIIHIGAAILWAGGAALFTFYLEPAIAKLGPDAEKFVDELVNRRRVPIYFAVTSTVAVIGGAILYYRDAGGFQLWTSTQGWAVTIGAVAGIAAWLGGSVLIAPGVAKVAAIGAEMKAAGGPPSAELMGRMHAAQGRLRMISVTDISLILVAIVAMESARYLV